MQTRKLAVMLVALAIGFVFGEGVEAQYALQHSVVGNGGAALGNGSYRIAGTIGQPLIGVTSSPSAMTEIGFWYLAGGSITKVDQLSNTLPTEYRLDQNYPNPFNPSTTFRFALPRRSSVVLKIFDVLGQEVMSVLEANLQPGEHKVVFDAKALASGVYFCRLQAEGFVSTKRLSLLR